MKTFQNMNWDEIFSYVIKAVQNTSINMLKCKERHKTINIEDCYDLSDKNALIDLCVVENYEVIVKSIKKMDILYRAVFYLYYIEDIPLKEIARMLDRKPACVRKQISRGRAIFIDNLKRELEIDGGI